MAEYGKKTVADLTEILKSRGLPHTGKKADLIARLTENDQKAEIQPAEEPAPVAAEPEVESAAAPPSAEPSTDAQAPTQQEDTTAPADSTAEASAPAVDTASYALNLPTSDIDSELAKRKARAERFGTTAVSSTTNGADAAAESTPQADTSSEALKALERAKRFGAAESGTTTAISKLDEALPTDGPRGGRGSKRKAEGPAPLDDPGLKRNTANRGRGGGRGGRFAHRQRGGAANGRGPHAGVTKAPAYTSEKDKAAADARKKKFATA